MQYEYKKSERSEKGRGQDRFVGEKRLNCALCTNIMKRLNYNMFHACILVEQVIQ